MCQLVILYNVLYYMYTECELIVRSLTRMLHVHCPANSFRHMFVYRPLTDAEIAARRQLARQAHQARTTRQELTKEQEKDDAPSSASYKRENG